jgi:hypothetical protein
VERREIRLRPGTGKRLAEESRRRGFASLSAFIRAAIENELAGRSEELGQAEARIAATLERHGREIRRLATALHAHFALTDALAKVILLCVPEPTSDAYDQAKARAKARYERFLKSVAISMKGDARAALLELVQHAD